MKRLAHTLASLGILGAGLGLARSAAAEDDYFLGAERLMGLFAERQSRTIEQGNISEKTSEHSTSVGVLALDGDTVSSVPRIAFDAFLTPMVSVGGSFIYTSVSESQVFSAEGNSQDQNDDLGGRSFLALNPRAGVRLPLSDRWGVWPRAGLLLASLRQHQITDQAARTKRETSWSTLSFTLDAMFYARPLEHVVLMGGPFLDLGALWGSYTAKTDGDTDLDGDARLSAYGVCFGMGAFF